MKASSNMTENPSETKVPGIIMAHDLHYPSFTVFSHLGMIFFLLPHGTSSCKINK